MRLALEKLKRGFVIHHGKLGMRLVSVRSLMHYLSYQIYDRGITLTPSYVSKDEVLRYLLDTYGSDELEPIKSYASGIYELNFLMLEFGAEVTTNPELKKDLELLSAYYRARKTEENISMYLYKKRSFKGNVMVKPFAKFEYGRIVFKGVNDLSYTDNYYTVGNAKEIFVSHIFYDALADYAEIPRNDEWTFRKELTRERESKYISLILDGKIKPNTDIGKKVYKAYMKVVTTKSPNLIYEETFMRRMEEIDRITEQILDSGKQLRGVTDYSVIYEDSGEELKEVPVYAGYYAWDHDLDQPLDDVNRLRGIGGEFTRNIPEGRIPYEVIVDGREIYMYPVEIERNEVSSSKLLSTLQDEYDELLGNKRSETYNDYRIKPSDLEPSGLAYIGDNDYIRVLNATDLELNGDITMFMAPVLPKLNVKSLMRSVREYHRVRGEGELELNAKTVIDENKTMFVKQHLKFYQETPNNEQVVEGLIMLNEDLKVPRLYTVLSGETVVPLSEDDLEKKRIGVYVKENDAVYAYKFIVMFNTKSKTISRIKDVVVGVNRRGRNVQPLSLSVLGLNEEQEKALSSMVKKEVVDTIIECGSNFEYFKKVLKETVDIEDEVEESVTDSDSILKTPELEVEGETVNVEV
jgi:hypothetical protein